MGDHEMEDLILDTVLFETVILHQPLKEGLNPKEIRELMIRFGFWVGKFMEIFGGDKGKEKFEVLEEWTKPWEVKKK